MKFKYFLQILWLISPLVWAGERQINCKVVGISDGDTLTCLVDRHPLKVRLLYIDAPESSQPFGQKAKQFLAAQVFKKEVKLLSTGYDKYQRLLAVVYDEKGREVNLALIKAGMAWAYYQTKPEYQQAEQAARQAHLGLWQDKNPINPYEWRKQKPLGKITPVTPLQTHKLDCEHQMSCKQINDYRLAKMYFEQCGWKSLDGNHDGIPCNKLYRRALR